VLKTGVSYFGSRIQRHVKEDMENIVRHNCNLVVHTYSESDMEFCEGTMKEIVDLSHKQGLEVWIDPWAVGGVFGGESYSKFVAKNLDAREVSSKTGELLPAACLNNEKFKDFMRSWVDSAIYIGADCIFWDEPHFYLYPLDQMERDPQLWACKCDCCRGKFKERFNYDMPSELNDDIKLFKEDSIVDFLRTMCDYVKTSDQRPKGVPQGPERSEGSVVEGRPATEGSKNAVCFLPFKGEHGGIMDWSKAAKIDSLEIIGTDPYWKAGERDVAGLVSKFSRKITDLAKQYNKEGQIWILNFRIKRGTERDIETAVMAAYNEGIRNLAAWSYEGTGCMSSLTSDDPEKVWNELSKAYLKIRNLKR